MIWLTYIWTVRACRKNRRKALDLFEKAARFGWADPANDAGDVLAYHGGIDDKPDYNEAFKWYLKAAERGSAHSQYEVADAYRTGKGISPDAQESARWIAKYTSSLPKKALAGDADSQYWLARAYESGLGISKNESEARRWYEKAVAQGHPHACNQLGLLLWNLRPVTKKNQATAVALFKEGARNGCPFAQLNLARHYDAGLPGTKEQLSSSLLVSQSCRSRERAGIVFLSHAVRIRVWWRA